LGKGQNLTTRHTQGTRKIARETLDSAYLFLEVDVLDNLDRVS
jgi:hypothetical protein